MEARDPVPADTPHCPHCLAEVGGAATHFCRDCGMPLTMHAATGPMEQVWALGYLVNRLLEQPPTALVVLGVWLIFLPVLTTMTFGAIAIMVTGYPGLFSLETTLGGLPAIIIGACHAILVVRVTLAYARNRLHHRSIGG